jgi:hypothetical protein
MTSEAPGASEIVVADGPEAALAQIETLKADKDFYNKLKQQDPAAHAQWHGLHKAAYPIPPAVGSMDDVNNQAAQRNAEQMNTFIASMRARWPMTPEMEQEIRGGVIREEFHKQAQEEKDRLIKDREFRRKLLDGDRAANEHWGRTIAALSLRPVRVPG